MQTLDREDVKKFRRKHVFTTGEVAKMCQVAPRTVSKWSDAGRIKGYRIPGSQDRRFPRECVKRFLKEYGMPLHFLGEAQAKIVLVGLEAHVEQRLREMVGQGEGWEIHHAADVFAAGLLLGGDALIDVVVADLALGRSDAIALARRLKASEAHDDVFLIGLANEDEQEVAALEEVIFDRLLVKPFDVAALAAIIRDHVGDE